MKWKIPFSLIMVASLILLTGFMEIDYHIEVDEEEKAQVKLIVQVDDQYSEEEIMAYINEHFYLQFEESNYVMYDYSFYEREGKRVMVAEALYPYKLSEFDIKHFNAFGIYGNTSGHRRTLPFYKKVQFDAEMGILERSIKGYVNHSDLDNEKVDAQVHLKVPFTVKEHNGVQNGEEIVWQVDPRKVNMLSITYVKNELYKPVLLVVGVIALILFAKRIRKRNQASYLDREGKEGI